MMLWLVLFAVTAVAMILLVAPLWRRGDGERSRAAFDAQVYRDQLAEIDRDSGRGLLDAEQAAAARTEIARRLLATEDDATKPGEAAGRITRDGARAATAASRRGIAAFVAVAVPVAAFGVYMVMGSPHLPGRPAAELRAEVPATPEGDDMATLVARLGEKLRDRPNDLQGWQLYARSLASLGRFHQAVIAYRKVTAMAPQDVESMSRFAEAQIFAAQGQVTPAAREALERTLSLDAKEPRARYYIGLAESQAGRLEEALAVWLALEADTPPDAPWRELLGNRITKLAATSGITPEQLASRRKRLARAEPPTAPQPAARQAAPGPSAEDIRAAQSMSKQDRMAMIRGMVARLAERLEREPDDLGGWQRLARAYTVLGETEKAREARARIAKLQAGGAPAPAPAAPTGPTEKQVEAAQSMSPADRQTMIRGMVARLADRLEREPGDVVGWKRLARSYEVLGEAEKARDAHAQVAKLLPDDVGALEAYAAAIARTLPRDAPISDNIVKLGERILTLDPRHTGALWFTGLARLQHGDREGARERWTRLLGLLDPANPQHGEVKKSLDALGPPATK